LAGPVTAAAVGVEPLTDPRGAETILQKADQTAVHAAR